MELILSGIVCFGFVLFVVAAVCLSFAKEIEDDHPDGLK